jgi:hypothetical protein
MFYTGKQENAKVWSIIGSANMDKVWVKAPRDR